MKNASEQTDEDVAVEASAHHVAVKPPPFMETAVPGWFAIMEAQFQLAKIANDETKFYHTLAALPPTTISKLDPAMLNEHKFKKLKTAVKELYEKSKSELFDELISKVQLTGRPSHFVMELQELAGKVGVGDDLVRHKLFQSLPPAVGAVLAAQHGRTLHQLGKLADELMPLLQTSCLATPAQALFPQPFQPQQQQFESSEAYHQQQDRGATSRPVHQQSMGGRALPLGLKPFYRDQRPQVCRAHLYFGAEARTCKPWCKWPQKRQVTMQPSSRRASPERNQEN